MEAYLKQIRFCIATVFFSLSCVGVLAAERVLVVGSGGWMSCRQGVQSQFIASQLSNLVDNLSAQFPDKQFDVLLTCSSGLAAANNARPLEYFHRSGSHCRYGKVPACELASLVRQIAPPGTHIFLIGHSHGGWHVMQAAMRLDFVEGLFTIEAISAAECDTRAFLRNRSRRFLTQRNRIEPGCRRAPVDVDTAAILSATRGNWYNHHLAACQDRGDLHSSEAFGAINFAYYDQGGSRAHHRLGLDHRVWTQICQDISRIMSGSVVPGCCPGIIVDDQGKVLKRIADTGVMYSR